MSSRGGLEQETQSTFAQSSSGGTDLENRLMDIAWGGEEKEVEV